MLLYFLTLLVGIQCIKRIKLGVINLENMDIIYHCPLENFDAKFIIDKGIQLDTNICVWIEHKYYKNNL